MSEYISRSADPLAKAFLKEQWDEAAKYNTIHCICGQKRHLIVAYRCLYCGQWFCTPCAEKHFGQTIQEWIEKKRSEKRCDLAVDKST